MEKEFYNEIYVDTESDTPEKMQLTYYLLSENISDEHCDLKIYGAEIDKTIGGKTEKKIMRDLFFRRSDAEEFMRKISSGTVTPMGLKYAVQEHICESLNYCSCEE